MSSMANELQDVIVEWKKVIFNELALSFEGGNQFYI